MPRAYARHTARTADPLRNTSALEQPAALPTLDPLKAAHPAGDPAMTNQPHTARQRMTAAHSAALEHATKAEEARARAYAMNPHHALTLMATRAASCAELARQAIAERQQDMVGKKASNRYEREDLEGAAQQCSAYAEAAARHALHAEHAASMLAIPGIERYTVTLERARRIVSELHPDHPAGAEDYRAYLTRDGVTLYMWRTDVGGYQTATERPARRNEAPRPLCNRALYPDAEAAARSMVGAFYVGNL